MVGILWRCQCALLRDLFRPFLPVTLRLALPPHELLTAARAVYELDAPRPPRKGNA